MYTFKIFSKGRDFSLRTKFCSQTRDRSPMLIYGPKTVRPLKKPLSRPLPKWAGSAWRLGSMGIFALTAENLIKGSPSLRQIKHDFAYGQVNKCTKCFKKKIFHFNAIKNKKQIAFEWLGTFTSKVFQKFCEIINETHELYKVCFTRNC